MPKKRQEEDRSFGSKGQPNVLQKAIPGQPAGAVRAAPKKKRPPKIAGVYSKRG